MTIYRMEAMCQGVRSEATSLLLDSCSADTNVYTPQVSDVLKPIKNREFQTLDELFELYNKYAFEAGFSVRRSSRDMSKDGTEIIRQEFCCHKEGHYKFIITSRLSLQKDGMG